MKKILTIIFVLLTTQLFADGEITRSSPWRRSGTNTILTIPTNNVGIGTATPTAVLHLKAGTATENTAPLKFTSGVLNTTAEAGAVEFLTDAYYGTITTGSARKTFAFLESPTFTTQIITPLIIGGTATTSDLNLQTTSGIGATGADMHFLVGNNGATEAMTILNNGNVGIGTTGPTNALSFGGSAPKISQSTSDGADNSRLTIAGGGSDGTARGAYIELHGNEFTSTGGQMEIRAGNVASTGKLVLGTGSGINVMTIDAAATADTLYLKSGNVGIGTTTPGVKLSVSGGHIVVTNASVTDRGLDTTLSGARTTGSYGYVLANTSTSSTASIDKYGLYVDSSGTWNGTSANNYGVYVRPSGGTTDWGLYVTGEDKNYFNGNVGIGTTTPGAKLDFGTLAGSPAVYLYNGGAASRLGMGIQSSEFQFFNAVGNHYSFNFGGDLQTSGTNEVIRILSTGNVGIGTTGPATKLDVAGDMQVSSAVALSLGGYVRKYTEATATLTGANTTIQVNIPAGARILGTQLRVDTLVASADGGTSWAANYTGGAAQAIGATGQVFTKNTKLNALFNDTTETDIVGSETDILIDCDGAFTFSAGVIRAIVYWETVTAMGNAA